MMTMHGNNTSRFSKLNRLITTARLSYIKSSVQMRSRICLDYNNILSLFLKVLTELASSLGTESTTPKRPLSE